MGRRWYRHSQYHEQICVPGNTCDPERMMLRPHPPSTIEKYVFLLEVCCYRLRSILENTCGPRRHVLMGSMRDRNCGVLWKDHVTGVHSITNTPRVPGRMLVQRHPQSHKENARSWKYR